MKRLSIEKSEQIVGGRDCSSVGGFTVGLVVGFTAFGIATGGVGFAVAAGLSGYFGTMGVLACAMHK